MKICFSLLQTAKPIRTIRNASTKLPKYPVPTLHETLEKYLKSVKPFLSNEEFITTADKIKDFGEPGGIGEELQNLLLEKAEKEENWLSNWWLNTAYLEYRNPVVVYSSPGLVFPQQKFSNERESLEYAAKITAAALDYKFQIDNNKIAQEMMGKDPLDMSQYGKIFGTCRLPGKPRDKLVFHPDSNHIVVAYKNNFFKVCVKEKNMWLKHNQILQMLERIVNYNIPEGPPIGLLTTNHRDRWTEAYKELLSESVNVESLKSIEEALFLLCLDSKRPEFCKNEKTTAGIQTVHGGGSCANAANRWFDKTIQLIVNSDGSNGLTYEHSPSEGQPIAVLMDYIVNYIKTSPVGDGSIGVEPELLSFCPSEKLECYIEAAKSHLDELVDDLEFNCFTFEDFGKDSIKKHKLSPDSFLQMAMQYAFYKVHSEPAAHYESAATRKFVGGRTETIRSCSEESVRFAAAMCNDSLSCQSKANALRLAVNSHKNYTLQALNARGVDRHLLGLKLTAVKHQKPLHCIYSDVAFSRSSHMRLSTSQVASACDGFMVYGPLVKDGYACCYNPRKGDINFGTTAFRSCKETDLDNFKDSLNSALVEMDEVLTKAPVAKL